VRMDKPGSITVTGISEKGGTQRLSIEMGA